MCQYFEWIICKHPRAFRKTHSAQVVLISLLENWRSNVDQGLMFVALLTKIPKADDFLPHDVFIYCHSICIWV